MKNVVIDAHMHMAFLEDARQTQEQLDFCREMMGLYKTSEMKTQVLFNMLDFAGIDKVFLLPLDLSASCGGHVGTNEQVKRLVARYPDRFIGFCSIDPDSPDALQRLERAFEEGFSGLKLHPSKQRFYPYDPKMRPIYKMCVRYDKPIIFHSGMSLEPHTLSKFARPQNFEEVAENYPSLRFCLAHFGWPWVNEVCTLLLKYRNVYTDTALLYFDDARQFYGHLFGSGMGRNWLDRSLRHQVMFGSDEPRLELIRMKKALENLPMRDSTRELIFGLNALEFIGEDAV